MVSNSCTLSLINIKDIGITTRTLPLMGYYKPIYLCHHPYFSRPDPLGRDHEYHGPRLPLGDREWHLRHLYQAGQPAKSDGEYHAVCVILYR